MQIPRTIIALPVFLATSIAAQETPAPRDAPTQAARQMSEAVTTQEVSAIASPAETSSGTRLGVPTPKPGSRTALIWSANTPALVPIAYTYAPPIPLAGKIAIGVLATLVAFGLLLVYIVLTEGTGG